AVVPAVVPTDAPISGPKPGAPAECWLVSPVSAPLQARLALPLAGRAPAPGAEPTARMAQPSIVANPVVNPVANLTVNLATSPAPVSSILPGLPQTPQLASCTAAMPGRNAEPAAMLVSQIAVYQPSSHAAALQVPAFTLSAVLEPAMNREV